MSTGTVTPRAQAPKKEIMQLVHMILAITIFLLVYIVLITEKFHRTVIALLGGIVMILFGILQSEEAFTHYIEWHTITLLIGMMILVGITNQTGTIQFLAIKVAKLARGQPLRILLALSLLTALLSALLDNVTTVLIIVPVTFSITRILQVNPVPFLISQIITSNIGGTATLIGDPPNIMIGSANPHLTFNAFLINLAPIALLTLLITIALLAFIYRRQFTVEEAHIKILIQTDERKYIKDRTLLTKSLVVLGLTFLGFLLHPITHIEASAVAIAGAAILMFIGLEEHDVERVFHFVEWQSIFFFIGLFTLVGGLQEVGVITYLAKQTLTLTQGNIALTAMLTLWGAGLASSVIDNIPFVATMIPLVEDMAKALGLAIDSPQINVLWWSLALGACLGGNGSLIGASANVVVASLATREGHRFSYLEYLKVGAPLTILSLLLATGYIVVRYLLFLP
jgi:Na+/H+ antiporter NhaD/arsenite permease-like protein